MEHDPTSRPQSPRAEPEIIPPAHRGDPRARGRSRVWIAINTGDGRTYAKAPGPFTVVMAIVALVLVSAVVLMLLLGALLIWVPVVALLVAGFLVAGFLKGYLRRPR